MKNIKQAILIICIFLNFATYAANPTPSITPENTIICSDIDEVLTKKSSWTPLKLIYYGLIEDPFNIGTYIKAIYNTEKKYTKDARGHRNPLYDQYGNIVNGFTFHLLFHGMNDASLTPYVELILEAVESSRNIIS